MADVLDHLQKQEDLLNRLHIQAARQLLIRGGESLCECECCGNDIPLKRQQTIPGVRTCTECQRVLEIRQKHYLR
ncbi:TraR/DksA C4-type zinc finger protein (plasmid) [Citrobacter portucalensis]|uniref:TraR/DksA C4-type zinc finger protein n=1 Tax=Citrobacter portucalensis TaxID=1639133 RepID=UPI00158114FF|nr:TraR/DksA C4-type zinc finger protein [Citrobacter portucalensis]NUH52123.1 TraR/DksA C4-type zinc finger protein [Citrobacter portucalensis]